MTLDEIEIGEIYECERQLVEWGEPSLSEINAVGRIIFTGQVVGINAFNFDGTRLSDGITIKYFEAGHPQRWIASVSNIVRPATDLERKEFLLTALR